MKTLLFLFLLLSLHSLSTQELLSKHPVDIEGDGHSEWIGLREFQRDGVVLGQMVMMDDRGNIVWEGSKEAQEFIFLGEFDGGAIEAAYRTNDGQVFVIGSYQKSDVRPTRFRLFTWHDHRFVHLRDGQLSPHSNNPKRFVWADDPEASLWVEAFEGSTDHGLLKIQISDLQAGSQDKGLLRPSGQDYIQVH